MDLVEALQQLFEVTTQEAWTSQLFSIAIMCGFSRILFGLLPNKTQPVNTALVISNYPSKWRSIYQQNYLYEIDPTVAHCFSRSVPVVWSDELFRTRDQKMLYEEAKHHDLRYGISYPIHGSSGEFGMLSFVSEERIDRVDRLSKSTMLSDLALIRDYAFESSLSFAQEGKKVRKPVALTSRELECLRWAAAGKSSWDISLILGCSESTVNFHISNINKKFGVRTRQQAVVRAIFLGLIVPT